MNAMNDPWAVLGLTADATDAELRVRYVELTKQHPPDRDPQRFEQIRAAYDAARDRQAQLEERAFGPPPLDDLDQLAELLGKQARIPVGLDAWLEALQ